MLRGINDRHYLAYFENYVCLQESIVINNSHLKNIYEGTLVDQLYQWSYKGVG